MKKFAILAVLWAGSVQAQTANDLVKTWLSQHSIVATDYATCDPAPVGVVGTDGICKWGVDLGTQPTPAQLLALSATWLAQQTAAANSATAQSAYNAAMSAGLTVSCSSSATVCVGSIAATYATDAGAQADIAANRLSIIADGVMSNGSTSMPWADVTGTFHTMTIAQFNEFATAVKQFVTAWKLYALAVSAGQGASPPSSSVQLQ